MEFHIIIEDDYVDIRDLKRQNTIYKCLVITNYFILRIYDIKKYAYMYILVVCAYLYPCIIFNI